MADDTAPYVQITDLTKIYRTDPALDSVSLDIAQGECLTLLGPSGSGKSTLLKLLAGFESATSGSIRLAGQEITGLSPAERECGMVFQNYALFPHMTVADNIEYGLRIRRLSKQARAARVSEMLELVGLTGYGDRRTSQLSGGQQQRVAIARALAYEPPLLLMDEPLGALDRSLRLEMVEQIRRIHRDTGTTLVYVTHDQQEALAISDRIAIMRDARIVECATPQELYRAPKSDFVATFFGDANLLDVEAQAASSGTVVSVGTASVTLPSLTDAPAKIAVRPRAFALTPPAGDALALAGTVWTRSSSATRPSSWSVSATIGWSRRSSRRLRRTVWTRGSASDSTSTPGTSSPSARVPRGDAGHVCANAAPRTTRRREDALMSRAERVDRLIEATKRTIERSGIKGATFRAIVKEADESLGTATYYFTSLEHLVESAMRDTMEGQLTRSRAWFAARPDIDRVDLLMEWFLSRIQQTEDVEHGYVMYLAAISQPGYQHVAKEWVAGYVGVLEEVTGDHASAVLVDALLDACFVRVMLGGPETIGDPAHLRASLSAIVGAPRPLASVSARTETTQTGTPTT